jgi:hypothetical protein
MATRKKTTRLGEPGRKRISTSARKRWRDYRAALAAGDWRTARKLLGKPLSKAAKAAARKARR